MKKIFTVLCLAVTAGTFAQTFGCYRTNLSNVVTQTITNGGSFNQVTIAGTTAHPSAAVEDKVLLKNLTSATHTYNVTRSIVLQTPSLILDNSSNTPNTYFCFGNNCFGSALNTPDAANYTPLNAQGQTSNGFYDNNTANGQPFVIYFNEGTTQGQYIVRYRVYNVSDPNDTLSFTVNYNVQSVGIKTQSAAASDLVSEIYPNPAGSSSKIYFTLNKDENLKFQIYNSLGGLVYSASQQKFAAGKSC